MIPDLLAVLGGLFVAEFFAGEPVASVFEDGPFVVCGNELKVLVVLLVLLVLQVLQVLLVLLVSQTYLLESMKHRRPEQGRWD